MAKCASQADRRQLAATLRRIALISQSRGRDSSGFAVRRGDDSPIQVLRAPMKMSDLVRDQSFAGHVRGPIERESHGISAGGEIIAAIGHSRLVTNGSQLEDHNNQPVVRSGVVGVHNGIVVNEEALWAQVPGESPRYDIDTEALLALFSHRLAQSGSPASAIRSLSDEVHGSFSIALLPADRAELVLGTNTGSLYVMANDDIVVFASERYMLRRLQETAGNRRLDGLKIEQIRPHTGRVVSLIDLRMRAINGTGINEEPRVPVLPSRDVKVKGLEARTGHRSLLVDFRTILQNPNEAAERGLLRYDLERFHRIRRCSKCVLPSTFPFIEFDTEGVCNYCRNYVARNHARPLEDLERLVAPYRSSDGEPDCIVPYSGGRDSTFALHMVKTQLKMNPITITYDWGMVTDLARRNIARVCGKLGVENVIVAADVAWKRDNIRKNIAAWLKRPDLGMIPLFMSGDKYFFYHTHRLKRQTGIRLNLWGINRLENTDFKTGFAGVPPKFDKRRIYSMSLRGHLRFWGFVGSNIVRNPAFINSSNLDSIGSIASRYLFPQRDYYSFFDYYGWDEREIEDTITREYDWERAIGTDFTWRIGDGTASFYNYVYFTVAGFCENDTFRSNQIREGLLTRESALCMLETENRPRYEYLRWYLDIVGLDYTDTIKRINAIPLLHE